MPAGKQQRRQAPQPRVRQHREFARSSKSSRRRAPGSDSPGDVSSAEGSSPSEDYTAERAGRRERGAAARRIAGRHRERPRERASAMMYTEFPGQMMTDSAKRRSSFSSMPAASSRSSACPCGSCARPGAICRNIRPFAPTTRSLKFAKRRNWPRKFRSSRFASLGVDAIIVFSDILIVAEAMGLPLDVPDSGPVLSNPVRDAAAVRRLRDFDPERETKFVGDAIRASARRPGPDVPVIGFRRRSVDARLLHDRGPHARRYFPREADAARAAGGRARIARTDRARDGRIPEIADRRRSLRRSALRHLGGRT